MERNHGHFKSTAIYAQPEEMKPRTHHHVFLIIAIMLGLAAAGMVMLYHEQVLASGVNFGFALFGTFLLIPILFHNLVVLHIAADCPKCSGTSNLKGHKKYTCSRCGHVTDVALWGPTGRIEKKIRQAAETNSKR